MFNSDLHAGALMIVRYPTSKESNMKRTKFSRAIAVAFLGTALLYTVIVGVLAVAIYFGYQNVLQRTVK